MSPVFLACANDATPELRQESRAELVKLIEHHPPFSNATLAQRIMLANTMKDLTETPVFPTNSEEMKKNFSRQSAIEALDEVVHPRMADSDLLPEKYFSLSPTLNAENKRWLALKNPYLMDGHGSPIILYFHRDVFTLATLRALYLAVLALDEAPSNAGFLAEYNSPKWADPRTGKPFESGADEHTGTFRIFSHGHNGVDDRSHSKDNDNVIMVLPKKSTQ